MAGLHPLFDAGTSHTVMPRQRSALLAAGLYRPELMLGNGVTLSGLAIEIPCSKDPRMTVAFTLGQAAPSCISNTS